MRILGRFTTTHSPEKTALEIIRDAEYPLVATQWKGVPVLVKCRELTQVQIMAAGSFSLINLGEVREGPFRWAQWVAYAEQSYKLLRLALVSPSYGELFELVGKGSSVKEAEEKFRSIDALLVDMPRGPRRQEYEAERDGLRCLFDLILPDDFVAPLVAYAVGIGKSDIKKVTRDMLLTSAILAERGHDNPADHIDGTFTPFNRDDINARAWEVLNAWRDEHADGPRGGRHVR
jgi:hypothetical protein